MKIAVYGKMDEVSKQKKQLQKYFQTFDEKVEIDTYTNQELMIKQLSRYDSVCMTENAVDLITGAYANEVMFEWGKKVRTCNVNDVYYAEADLKNVHICFERKELLVRMSFSRVEQILSIGDFIKVHRSYLVNCQYVHSIDEHSVILKDGRTIPLSKYRSEDVRKQFSDYMKGKEEKENNKDEIVMC
ncbi:MAG: LytTR family transcriptional regulator [Lachnospiraceae bacterium]|nr:LytTR family transcriptional regulator [Lachnospiraceae bacterium]